MLDFSQLASSWHYRHWPPSVGVRFTDCMHSTERIPGTPSNRGPGCLLTPLSPSCHCTSNPRQALTGATTTTTPLSRHCLKCQLGLAPLPLGTLPPALQTPLSSETLGPSKVPPTDEFLQGKLTPFHSWGPMATAPTLVRRRNKGKVAAWAEVRASVLSGAVEAFIISHASFYFLELCWIYL